MDRDRALSKLQVCLYLGAVWAWNTSLLLLFIYFFYLHAEVKENKNEPLALYFAGFLIERVFLLQETLPELMNTEASDRVAPRFDRKKVRVRKWLTV